MPHLPKYYDEESDRDYFQDLIWSMGLKITVQRRALLELFSKDEKPLSIKEITTLYPDWNISSVYRTIKLFEEVNLICYVGNKYYVYSFGKRKKKE